MPLCETILVPTDFSPHAAQALEVATELAKSQGAALHLAHVLDVLPYTTMPGGIPMHDPGTLTRAREDLMRGLAIARERLIKAGVTRVDTTLIEGQPFLEIVDLAKRIPAQLIVMGTHGRSGKVVDLWGGLRDRSGAPWREDTMTVVHSTTKGLAAMVMALAHSRGWLEFDAPVCHYWPEFAQNCKERITVRQLLAHQAGLFGFDEPVDREVILNPDRLAEIMARQRPAWEPGERQAYHAISLGFYESELIRRVDPSHRTLGQVFAQDIARPLELDFYIGLPSSIPDLRIAPLEPPSRWQQLRQMPWRLTLAAMNHESVLYRSLIANPGTQFYLDPEHVVVRNLEVPSGGGVGTAQAIAKAYGVFAAGGRELGLRSETLAQLTAPAIPSRHGFFDECMRGTIQLSLGFMKPSESFHFGHASSYGAPGAGGSMGYADPELRLGYGYVTNHMGMSLSGDPRDVALRAAIPDRVSTMVPSAGPAGSLGLPPA